jgi:hypothetical protein
MERFEYSCPHARGSWQPTDPGVARGVPDALPFDRMSGLVFIVVYEDAGEGWVYAQVPERSD